MERSAGWGNHMVQDGVRAGEDGNSMHTAQQHVMDEHGSRRYFLERDEDMQRGRRPVGPVAHRPRKQCPDGRTSGPKHPCSLVL
jgi:hypothetical protein